MSGNADKTYAMHIDEKRIYGFYDGIKAVEQMIYKILSTERYEWEIYSDDFGIELIDLIGKPKSEVADEIENRITDALSGDERILEIGDFEITGDGSGVTVNFTVKTIYGDITVVKEIG